MDGLVGAAVYVSERSPANRVDNGSATSSVATLGYTVTTADCKPYLQTHTTFSTHRDHARDSWFA